MNTPGRFVHRVLPAIAGFAFVLGSIAHPVMAQKAKPQQAEKTQAPLPVTPFGPRVKPPRAAGAVPAAPKAPQAEVIAEYGIWRVMCEKPPVPAKSDAKDAKAAQKVCYIQAAQSNPKVKGAVLSIFIFKMKGKGPDGKVRTAYMIDLRAPLGVYLPTGIGLEIDGKPVSRASFLTCNPIFCDSMAQTRKETINRLKKGKKAKFIYYAAPGRGLPIEFDLKGFSAAMKKLDEVSK